MNRPELYVLVAAGAWVAMSIAISRATGWATLATFYRSAEKLDGERWRFQSAQMRWKMGYNNCLTFGFTPSGLFITMIFFFRFGHPSLVIPWPDISAERKKGFLTPYVELRFRRAPSVPFRVSERLGRRIVEQPVSTWSQEKPAGTGTL